MRDWSIKSKENSEEYRNSGYKEQPLSPLGLRQSTQRRGCRPCLLKRAPCGSLDGREVAVELCWQNLLEVCPLWKAVQGEAFLWRCPATELSTAGSRGEAAGICIAGAVHWRNCPYCRNLVLWETESATGVWGASKPEPGSETLPVLSLQHALLTKLPLAKEKYLKGARSILTEKAKKMNVE